MLWEPTHLGEFTSETFPYHRLDLLEEMYGLISTAIIKGKIRFKLLKKHHELLPYLFKWKPDTLLGLFNDRQQLSKLIANLANQQGGRSIIYE